VGGARKAALSLKYSYYEAATELRFGRGAMRVLKRQRRPAGKARKGARAGDFEEKMETA
jgi:hypothetical protein